MAPNASLVWRVENTWCPVMAARRAICAVGGSLISPIRMIFGSCLKSARSPMAKVRPIFGLTCIWLAPTIRYSTGSSIVEILMDFVLSIESTV